MELIRVSVFGGLRGWVLAVGEMGCVGRVGICERVSVSADLLMRIC